MQEIAEDKSEKWQKEKIVEVLYNNAAGAIFGTAASIAITTYVLFSLYPSIELLTWFLAGQVVSLVRFFFYSRYKANIKQFKNITWLKTLRFLTFLSGSLYGTLAIFFFSSNQPLYQVLVILLVAGICTAAVATLSIDNITYRSFLAAAMIPLILRCIWEGTEVHYAISALLALSAIVLLISANKSREILLENIQMSQSIRYRATHDVMVDLLNRHEFQNEFAITMAASQGDDSIISIIFIDLDNFKSLNDTYGHQAGDKALIDIADIIRRSIRKSDIAARFGGDEFMILIQSLTVADAQKVAENILQKIIQFQDKIEMNDVCLGASMGIGYTQNKELNFETLLNAADTACYSAKKSGNGGIRLKEVNQNITSKRVSNRMTN